MYQQCSSQPGIKFHPEVHPSGLALETLAALELSLVNRFMAILDLCSTISAHLEMLSLDTDLCG